MGCRWGVASAERPGTELSCDNVKRDGHRLVFLYLATKISLTENPTRSSCVQPSSTIESSRNQLDRVYLNI